MASFVTQEQRERSLTAHIEAAKKYYIKRSGYHGWSIKVEPISMTGTQPDPYGTVSDGFHDTRFNGLDDLVPAYERIKVLHRESARRAMKGAQP